MASLRLMVRHGRPCSFRSRHIKDGKGPEITAPTLKIGRLFTKGELHEAAELVGAIKVALPAAPVRRAV